MTKISKKCDGGYVVESDSLFTFELHYDQNGNYVGQVQDNMLDDSSLTLFFEPEMIDGVPCVNGKPVPPLTAEQMASAQT